MIDRQDKATLKLTRSVFQEIKKCAQSAGGSEIIGFLTRSKGGSVVDGVCFLPAAASASHATASPPAIRQALEELRHAGREPVGLVHSHGNHAVFHSGTDERTIAHLLPAVARPVPDWPASNINPAVTAPDEAQLPLPDGRIVKVLVVGQKLPGGLGFERTRWSNVHTRLEKPIQCGVMAFDGDTLRLAGQDVIIELGIPAGASVSYRVEQAEVGRRRAYSLVVNRRGEAFAEALILCEDHGRSFSEKVPCELETIDGAAPSEKALNRNFVSYDEVTGTDCFGRRRKGIVRRVWESEDVPN